MPKGLQGFQKGIYQGFGFQKEHIPWNKNIPHSKESNEKNRLAHLGKHCSKETKKKMRLAHLGKKLPEAQKIKISQSKKGIRTSFTTGCQPGNKHWNWRGGVSTERELIANRKKERIWAKKVKERDNWICQKCGTHKGKMIAHHKIFWTPKAESNYDLENGITLCKSCHRKLHWELRKKQANSVNAEMPTPS